MTAYNGCEGRNVGLMGEDGEPDEDEDAGLVGTCTDEREGVPRSTVKEGSSSGTVTERAGAIESTSGNANGEIGS